MKTRNTESVAIDSVQGLIETVEELPYADARALDALQRRARMVIGRVFGRDSSYGQDFNDITFLPTDWSNRWEFDESWYSGTGQMSNLFNTMLEEIIVFGAPTNTSDLEAQIGVTNRVFVVHGHDEEMRQAVARALEKLDLEPVILEERPSSGRTVIEKLDRYSDVSFAVVLLSADDLAYAKNAAPEKAKLRARQNVVHELGFFTGKLGRENVLVLHRKEEGFETPSNHAGVLYVPYAEMGSWRFDLARELRECGYVVDANKLL